MTPPVPDPDDELLAELLADAWVDAAAHNAVARREALRATGLLPTPRTLSELARQCGLSEAAAADIVRMGRARIARALLGTPDLQPRLVRCLTAYLTTI